MDQDDFWEGNFDNYLRVINARRYKSGKIKLSPKADMISSMVEDMVSNNLKKEVEEEAPSQGFAETHYYDPNMTILHDSGAITKALVDDVKSLYEGAKNEVHEIMHGKVDVTESLEEAQEAVGTAIEDKVKSSEGFAVQEVEKVGFEETGQAIDKTVADVVDESESLIERAEVEASKILDSLANVDRDKIKREFTTEEAKSKYLKGYDYGKRIPKTTSINPRPRTKSRPGT